MSLSLAVDNVFVYAQSAMHLLIAVNRFTAFFFPLEHSSIWNSRVMGGSIAASAALSVLLHVVPYYGLTLLGVCKWDGGLGQQYVVSVNVE